MQALRISPEIARIGKRYRDELLCNVAPFWLEHSIDARHGGYFNCLDRDGAVWETDKYLWMQARELWMWSTLCLRVERKKEWVAAARCGADFLRKHCLNAEGRVHFAVTQAGKPLLKPRDIFAESFVAVGMAAYGALTGASWATDLARHAYRTYLERADLAETHDGSQYPGARPVRMHGIAFIRVAMSQAMRAHLPDEIFDRQIERGIEDVLNLHVRGRDLFEYVRPDGKAIPGAMGRLQLPGHAVESAAFILLEAQRRRRKDWVTKAADVIERALSIGWDHEFGGVLYFVDHAGAQNRKLEGDMKLWWVHVECLFATILAWKLTGRPSMLEWFRRIDKWTWQNFPDRECGEWYGYLRKDGGVSLPLKGSMWKCFFHLPRTLLNVAELLDVPLAGVADQQPRRDVSGRKRGALPQRKKHGS